MFCSADKMLSAYRTIFFYHNYSLKNFNFGSSVTAAYASLTKFVFTNLIVFVTIVNLCPALLALSKYRRLGCVWATGWADVASAKLAHSYLPPRLIFEMDISQRIVAMIPAKKPNQKGLTYIIHYLQIQF